MGSEKAAILIVLCADAPADTRARIGEVSRITQTLPPRLLVVETDDPQALDAIPGIASRSGTGAQLKLDEPTNATEQLFIDAFGLAARKSGPRPGDTLPWDAEGFTPPR